MTGFHFTIKRVEKYDVVEIWTQSLMNPEILDSLSNCLTHLLDVDNRRAIVLDLKAVQFISGRTLNILIALHKKMRNLPNSSLVFCNLNSKLIELMEITRLARVLVIRSSQEEALKVSIP